jgi:hypothetical protein
MTAKFSTVVMFSGFNIHKIFHAMFCDLSSLSSCCVSIITVKRKTKSAARHIAVLYYTKI